MIEISNSTAQTLTSGQAIAFDATNLTVGPSANLVVRRIE